MWPSIKLIHTIQTIVYLLPQHSVTALTYCYYTVIHKAIYIDSYIYEQSIITELNGEKQQQVKMFVQHTHRPALETPLLLTVLTGLQAQQSHPPLYSHIYIYLHSKVNSSRCIGYYKTSLTH